MKTAHLHIVEIQNKHKFSRECFEELILAFKSYTKDTCTITKSYYIEAIANAIEDPSYWVKGANAILSIEIITP